MKQDGTAILLDAGDVFFAGPSDEVAQAKAKLLLDSYREMGYAALGIGTRDLAASAGFLEQEAARRDLRLLSANLMISEKLLAEPYAVFRVGKLRVGVVGITGPQVPVAGAGTEPVQVLDPEETLRKLIPVVRSKSDLVIALSNLGEAKDSLIAKAVPGIDVIIGSGYGRLLRAPLQVGKTYLLRTDGKGKSVGRAVIRVGKAGEILAVENEFVYLKAPAPEDPDIQKRVEEIAKLPPAVKQSKPEDHPFLRALQEAAKKKQAAGSSSQTGAEGVGGEPGAGGPQQPASNPLLELLRKRQGQGAGPAGPSVNSETEATGPDSGAGN